jgi:hypothetical protein
VGLCAGIAWRCAQEGSASMMAVRSFERERKARRRKRRGRTGRGEAEQQQEQEGKSNVKGKALVISQILDAISVLFLALRCHPRDLLQEHTISECVQLGRVAGPFFVVHGKSR